MIKKSSDITQQHIEALVGYQYILKEKGNIMKQTQKNHLPLIIIGVVLLSIELFASTGLAFEAGMDAFLGFFTGKFVFILSALAIIVSVGMFAFNHDAMGGVLKGFIGLLFVLGILGNILNLLNMFGLTNTGILI